MRWYLTIVLWAFAAVVGTADEVRAAPPSKAVEIDDLIAMFLLLALPENKDFYEVPGETLGITR